MAKTKKSSDGSTKGFVEGFASREAHTSPAVVLVSWGDACINNEGSFDFPRGWEQNWRSGVLMQTVGFLLKSDANWTTIGMERHAEADRGYRRVQDIPTCAIVRLEVLKKAKGG